jgi:hypothetical protein
MDSKENLYIIVNTKPYCNYCNICGRWGEYEHPYTLRVEKINREDKGWKAKGNGVLTNKENVICPTCAMMYDTILRAIPLECENYNCPNCGSKENLVYRVDYIERRKNLYDFSFEIIIVCKKCERKNKIVSAIFDILKTIKVKIGLGGISIENSK